MGEERGWEVITCWVEGAVGGEGQGVLGWATVKGEVDGLDITFVDGGGCDGGG